MRHHNKHFGLGRRASLSLVVATAMAATAATGLGGCGGGDDALAGRSPLNTSGNRQQEQQPTPATPVVASGGDAARYVGTWQGECGVAVINSQTTYLKYKFILSSANANVVQGQVEMTTYSDTRCDSVVGSPLREPITLSISTPPVTASGTLTGQADRVTLGGGIGMPSLLYFAFSTGYDQFWLAADPIYSELTIRYQKL